MIKIAVCDDNVPELRGLIRAVEEYGVMHPEYEAAVQAYASPYALLSEVENRRFHDVYLLDVLMPDLSGIQLGRRIRTYNDVCTIIYCTVTSEYAVESYQVQAQNYLIKPIRRDILFQALDQALSRLKRERSLGISLRTTQGQAFLPFHRIVSVELVRRRAVYQLSSGETYTGLVLRGSFQEAVAALLAEPRFLQTHKSFVVNMDYVQLNQGCQLILEDGKAVPLSIRRQALVLDRYFGYMHRQKGGAGPALTPPPSE